MSKAFTRESDDLNADEIAPLRPHPSSGVKNYITRQGADRIRERIEDLVERRRELMSAGSDVDTKANLRRVESEIQRLQLTLNSVIVAEPPADKEKVAFGASVVVRDSSGEEETYQIVGVDEAEPGEGRISASSPMARALMNRRAGETARFETPAGDQELTILTVHY